MSQILVGQQKGAPIDGAYRKWVKLGTPSDFQILNISASQINSPIGSKVSVFWEPPRDRYLKVEKLDLAFDVVNASGLDAGTVYNVFNFLESLELHINRGRVCHYNNTMMMMLAQRHVLREGQDRIYETLAEARNENSEGTIAGDSIPVSSTTPFRIPLLWIYPSLENWITNSAASGIDNLSMEIRFRGASNVVDQEATFIRSSTASNVYLESKISIANIRLRAQVTQIRSKDLLVVAPSYHPFLAFDIKEFNNLDFSDLNNSVTIKLKEFGENHQIQKLTVWCLDKGALTAYNDAEACRYLGGPAYLSWSLQKNGASDKLDLTSGPGGEGPQVLKDTTWLKFRMTYGEPPSAKLRNQATDLDKYHLPFLTEIDFRNIDIEKGRGVIGGASNRADSYELKVQPAQALSANVTVVAAIEWYETWSFKDGTPRRIP